MGILSSKHKRNKEPKKKKKKDSDNNYSNHGYGGGVTVESENLLDEKYIQALRHDFINRRDVFLLNNILMSVMFFENHESEMDIICKSKNTQLQEKPLKDYQKRCIKPDVFLEVVNKHVVFRPMHGPKKAIAEPLAPSRMYIIHDNIEIPYEDDHYSRIDQSLKAQIENTSRPGYIKLRYQEDEEKLSIASDVSSDGSVEPVLAPLEEDEIYDYGRINESRTPKPFRISQNSTINLPKNFLKEVFIKNINYEFDENNKPILYTTAKYLNSEELMQFFVETGFNRGLCKALGLSEDADTTSTASSIFYSYTDKNRLVQWEIIPAVELPTSHEFLWEWVWDTSRKTVTINKIKYRFPTIEICKEINNMRCVAIPRGFLPKRGTNPDSCMEWELAFPLAEMRMEKCMSHTQMRAYFFMCALFKTFIEPKTDKKGLLIEHIRALIFREIEDNAGAWPESRLGTKLLKIIKRFNEHMSQPNLPDFFLGKKNVFGNIARETLREAHREFYSIEQTPVMYFIRAIRNLRYTNSSQFYPPLDIKQLMNILTEKIMDNPAVNSVRKHAEEPAVVKQLSPEQIWKQNVYEERKRIRMEKKKKEEKEQTNDENLDTSPRESVDSINLKWTSSSVKMNVLEEDMTNNNILNFFVRHFIKIATHSIKYQARRQARFYLKQATYLNELIYEGHQKSNKKDILQTEKLIGVRHPEKNNSDESSEHFNEPPQIPARNSIHFAPSLTLSSNNTIDTHKLHEVHQMPQINPIKSMNKNIKRPKSMNNKNVTIPEDRTSLPVNLPDLPKSPKVARKSVAFKTDDIDISEV